MSKETTKPTYTKAVTYKATVSRLSSQKNQFGSYCYALVKHDLPKDAQILGNDGRQVFYSPTLKGEQGKEFELELAVVPVTRNTGEVVNRIVIARSEAEKKADEAFAKEVQQDAKEARAFGITKQQLGKSYFAAKYGAKFGVTASPSSDEDANA